MDCDYITGGEKSYHNMQAMQDRHFGTLPSEFHFSAVGCLLVYFKWDKFSEYDDLVQTGIKTGV